MNFAYRKLFLLFTGTVLCWLSAAPALAGLDAPHNASNGIGCLSCHDMTSTLPKLMPAWIAHSPASIDDTLFNSMCWSCHNDSKAAYVTTHSSLTTSDRYGDWTVECWVCHNLHIQQQLRTYGSAGYLYSATSTGVTATTLSQSGAGWEDDEFEGLVLVPNTANVNCNYIITGNTSDTLTVQGPMDLTKITTGSTFGIVLGKLVRSTINLGLITAPLHPEDKTGYKTVRYFRREGANSFADGNATFDGICEVCHTETKHFQNDGTSDDPEHDNLGSVAGSNCTTCHNHENGFAHGGGSGTGCIECHGHDAGTLYDPDMSAPYTAGTTASPGRGTVQSHSTHTETTGDDLKGPGIYCDTCHNIEKFPLFRSVADPNAELTLAETDVCDACHSEGGTYDGLDDPVVGAKTIWKTGAYVSTSDSTLQADKQKWCATCHDEDASIISGVMAPNVIGDEDGAYNYGTGWGFYKTGHGVLSSEILPASGGITNGPEKGCAECHDLSIKHIDGDARTFAYTSGDRSAQYQAGYRLKSINGGYPMHIPTDGTDSYRLCFSCHPNTEQWIGSQTERNGTNFWSGTVNDHYKHMMGISSTSTGINPDYDWNGTFEKGNPTCITCHNVHGSTNPAMVRDGSLNGKTGFVTRYGNDCENYGTAPGGVSAWTASDITLAESTILATQKSSIQNQYCANTCHGTGEGFVTISRTPATVVNRAPELNWVGIPGYESDGANPDAAPNGTEFAFKVKYSDTNQDPPDWVQLWLDRNGDGTYADSADPPEKIDMTSAFAELNGCAEYSKGVDYIATVTLDKRDLISGNTVNYRFQAIDQVHGDSAGGPATNERTLTLLNNPPSLVWTGEPNYTADGVNPDYGAQGGNYAFRVNYIDDDGDACPASGSADIQVWIDLDRSGAYDAGEKFNLTEVSAADTDCTTAGGGKFYAAEHVLPNSSGGTLAYSYRFSASDGTDAAAGAPVAPGGTVAVAATTNNPPFLAWDSGTCRPASAMPPRSTPSSTINFSVRYYDEDNECPAGGSAGIQVYVDLDDSGTYGAGEQFNLNAADGDGDCTAAGGGKLYTIDVTPTTVASGITYEFHASDGTDEALGAPRTGGGTVDVVAADYVVKKDGTEDYMTISAAVAAVGASTNKTILVYDGTYNENLTITQDPLTLVSACGAADTIISSTNDPVVHFNFSVGSILDGFTVTGGSGRGIYSNGTNWNGLQSTPTIKNSIIRDNGGRGIAAYASNVTVTGCEIYGNSGGGILSYATTITDTLIRNNSVTGNGGGIASEANGGSFTLTNVIIKDNTATGNGGGIYCDVSSSYAPSYEKVTLAGNSAGGSGGGGYFTYCSPTITNSLVSDNAASTGGGIGVGIWAGVQFRNSTIVNNTASTGNGGAFYSSDGAVNLANSIAWGNRATSGSGHIGYFSGNSKTIYLYDSILENNGDDNITDDNYFVAINNSHVNDTGTNYDSDPNFVTPNANGDYHLMSPSDAIDHAADNSGWGIPSDDLDGISRLAGSEDIGAYEYLP